VEQPLLQCAPGRNWDNFVGRSAFFTVLAFASVGLAIYQLYLNQWLQIRCAFG